MFPEFLVLNTQKSPLVCDQEVPVQKKHNLTILE